MTTPQGGFDASSAGGSRILGGVNSLQEAIDKLTSAVGSNTQAIQQAAANAPGGSAMPVGSTGQTVTYGRFPRMSPANAGFQAGTPANYATTPTGGQGNGAGGWGQTMNNPAGTLGAAGGQFGSTAQAAVYPGGAKFSNQITMNQYAAMSTLGMQPGTNLGQGMRAMYNQAFGSYNSNLNAIAQNPADAAQMYSNLQGIAASPYVMSTALGRAGFGASAGFGYSNPALGGAGSSAAAAQLYSGQTSMLMRMYGYQGTARAGMGQQNPLSMAQTMQTMIQRWYGSKSVNQNTLNAGLANNGRLQLNLKALGLDPNTMGPALQMYNKLFSQGLNAGQAQTLLNDAAHNQSYQGQSAQKLLSNKYGISTSDLQKLKDTTAVKTGTTAGEMTGFDSAISQATTTVQKFDSVLNDILKMTGLGSAMGFTHGLTGAMGSVGGALGGIVNKGIGFGLGMLSRLGGAGGTPSSSGTSGTGTPTSSVNRASGAAATAIKDAQSQLGKPYVWGGDNPSVGFDCSGLIEWAYAQAGIKLPRTSQEQWSSLRNRSVPLDKARAGDIVFSAGSDGSPGNPGHEAMLISNSSIIEAPYTGANIRVRAYNPGEWAHAGRPSGSLNASGGSGGTNGLGAPATTTGHGNSGGGGLGLAVGNYGSSSELENVSSALLGGIAGGSGGGGLVTFQASSVGNGQGSGPVSGNANVSTAGGGSAAANRALGMKMAKQMYGWTGKEWNALDKLWGTYESGWRNNAQNPGSTAFGIAQFLNSTWNGYGPKTSNPGLQIKYGLEYVHDRYKDPIHALQFELSHTPHWYGDGTNNAARGLALVGDRGPELVRLGGGQQVMNSAQTADILKGSHAKASGSAWSSGTAAGLVLAATPQNHHSAAGTGKCEVHLNMPPGAIVVHANGTASDVSNSVRQIMEGISEAMADNEMVQKIMAGVMG